MTSYFHPETIYEASFISTRRPIHINIDLRHRQPPNSTSNSMPVTTMLSSFLRSPFSALIHALIQLSAVLFYLALLITTYFLCSVRYLSSITHLTQLLSYLYNQFPSIVKHKARVIYEERRQLRRKYAEARTERLRERNEVGERERAQMREAVRRVAWKRGVGKMDYGIDLAEDEKNYSSSFKSKPEDKFSRASKGKGSGDENREIEGWIEDEVIIQSPIELQESLEKLENQAGYGKRAGYWDEEEQIKAKEAAKILLRNGEVEEFPRFEDMNTRE
ncbi:uncharacterized protein EAE97_000843 [Botrytis byssoidea]|uniref:Uncharacterized protein n=1 Tax=Botrytis byssoidea TaxID=139641 RepID=A0A9P5ITA2_9HELO|nr:uncharacterized protein EAE97_000843 [Botrytis byssoidea]KAF7953444.1 hypothetical protein EAE97_000843 [Botrytis byssoidea]